ncbi:hypothetical protein CTRI78_v003534 [Colletotrichum trifolii]|uniref:Uncharacterized protein n=1 Tax=Colletotrichum trifolii TaxID=5466 RepID=A0A4R8RJS6_COLTR|nr:hypothetical protein CTRI78_v003534 [Colletotrichum trifolii]
MKISHSLALAVFARYAGAALVAHCETDNPLGEEFNNCGSVTLKDCSDKCYSSCFADAYATSMSWNPSV